MLQRLVLMSGVLVLAVGLVPVEAGAQRAREGADGLAPPAAPQGAPSVVPPPPPPPQTQGGLGDVPPPPGSGYGPLSPSAYAPPQSSGFQVDADMATRLRVLDSDLQQLARAGNPIATGVITMATGGLSIALAFLATNDDFLRNYLVLYGSANVLTGITEIAIRPNASGPSIAFTHMPMGSPSEAQARLAFGEDALRRIARRSRAARLITASLDVAVGLAIIPMFLGPNDFSVGDPFDYFVLLGSGISVVTGLINLLTRSPAEKYWAAYGELDRRLRAPRPTVSLDVVPRRGGLLLSLSGTL
ncbi:MAG: hypothetical protein H6726_14995 [Sandaracinaceae bacterium]|nr:hypothetical protein [Myxococcales bacterium]MCB9658956.1 hypothetical protein [Sandaracinaceae bacterium]